MTTEQVRVSIKLPDNATFAERETSLTNQLHRIREDIGARGLRYIDHRIDHRSDSKAVVTVFFGSPS
jgi:hypothetical protein